MLSGLSVGQFVKRDEHPLVFHLGDRLDVVLQRLGNDPHAIFPVTDAEERYLGIVSLEEVYLASRIPDALSVVLVADLMRSDVVPLQLQNSVDRAMELFFENDLLELPVVDESDRNRVVGVVTRVEISGIYLRHVQGTGRGTEEIHSG